MLHKERELAAADGTLRGVWRRVLSTTASDELVLWFALSTCEMSLHETFSDRVPAPERLELKQALTAMLHGPASSQLPASARSKAIVVLAQLARAAWPTEEPALLHEILTLLNEPGRSRALGARLLSAIAEEFAASDSRRPAGGRAVGTSGQQQQAQRQVALVAFLPHAYRALARALLAEAEAVRAATAATDDADAAGLCLDACQRLIGFGRMRSGAESATRTFTPDERAELPVLLSAVCAHLFPSGGRHRPAVAALGVIAELLELQDPGLSGLVPPLVEPLVGLVQRLASEAAASTGPPQPRGPFGLDEDSLDELENALCFALNIVCHARLLRIAPDAAAPLLTALWAHSRHASAAQLQRFVRICNTLLEAAESLGGVAGGSAGAGGSPGGGGAGDGGLMGLADGLLTIAPELLSRMLLSQSAMAGRDFEGEAEELWEGDGGGTDEGGAALEALWAVDGLGGGGGGGDAGAEHGGMEEGEADHEGLRGLRAEVTALYLRLAAARPLETVNHLAGTLNALLPAFGAQRQSDAAALAICFDVATVSSLLTAVLGVAPTALDAPLTALPLSSIVTMLLGQLGPDAPPPSRSPFACRAELALIAPLQQCCRLLDGAYAQPFHASASAAPPAAPQVDGAVAAALASSVTTVLARATALLTGAAGGGMACLGASAVLLETAAARWPAVVHEAGGLRQLASLGSGSLSAHAASAGVPMPCWPRLFGAVLLAMIVPPRASRPAEYTTSHLPPPQQSELQGLVDALAEPLRATLPAASPSSPSAVDLALGPPASCLCAMVVAARDAPHEARAALDAALRASLLHEVLQTQLSALPLVSPPPLGAICALLRLLRALTRSVGASSVWGSHAAAQWALSAALQSIQLASSASGTGVTRGSREGLLEAALDLVLSAVSERRGGGGGRGGGGSGGSAALVSQVLEACGPQALGALLVPAAGAEASSLLSPPLREHVLRLGHALLQNHWRHLSESEPALNAILHLMAAGLLHPADVPAFRCCLPAVMLLHERLFASSAGSVSAAILAAGRLGPSGARPSQGRALPPPSIVELAAQLRCLVLMARLDASHASLHDEAAECVYAALLSEARAAVEDDGGGAGGGGDSGAQHVRCAWSLVERCLAMQSWLNHELASTLLHEFRSSDISDQLGFKNAVARLADSMNSLRAEAAHAGGASPAR